MQDELFLRIGSMTPHNSTHKDDQTLRDLVLGTLDAEQRFSQLEIRVGVKNRIIHLAGSVPTLELRDEIEVYVSKTSGIRGVVNRIRAPGAPSPGRTIDLEPALNYQEGDRP